MAEAKTRSTRCTVCAHPEVLRINGQIAYGEDIAEIARRFGLGHMSLRRHASGGHISDQVYAAARIGHVEAMDEAVRAGAEEDKAVLERLRSMYAYCSPIWLKMAETGAVRSMVALGDFMLRILDRIARVSGEWAPRPGGVQQINIQNNVQATVIMRDWTINLSRRLISRLAPYPEARAAVIDELEAMVAAPALEFASDN